MSTAETILSTDIQTGINQFGISKYIYLSIALSIYLSICQVNLQNFNNRFLILSLIWAKIIKKTFTGSNLSFFLFIQALENYILKLQKKSLTTKKKQTCKRDTITRDHYCLQNV